MYIARNGQKGRPKKVDPQEQLSENKSILGQQEYLVYLFQEGLITEPLLKAGELYRERYERLFFDAPKAPQQCALNRIGMESLGGIKSRGRIPVERKHDIRRFLQWQRLRTCLKRNIGEGIGFLDDILLYEPMACPFRVEKMPREIRRIIHRGLKCIHVNIK